MIFDAIGFRPKITGEVNNHMSRRFQPRPMVLTRKTRDTSVPR